MLIIKQPFKFLNFLLKFRDYQSMLLFRFSKQIRRAIVTSNSIKVMNFPALWERFIVVGFPNKDMFKHISFAVSSRIVRFMNKNISSRLISSTPPRRMVLSLPSFIATSVTKFSLRRHWLTTLRARNSVGLMIRKVIKFSVLLPFRRMPKFTSRLSIALPKAIWAKLLIPTCTSKGLPAIPTLKTKHHILKYITTITLGQVMNGKEDYS